LRCLERRAESASAGVTPALPSAGGRRHGEPAVALEQRTLAAATELFTFRHGCGPLPTTFPRQAAALREAPMAFCRALFGADAYCPVVTWEAGRDERRIVLLPPAHLLYLVAAVPFRVDVMGAGRCLCRRLSLPGAGGHFAFAGPFEADGSGGLLGLRVTLLGAPVTHLQSQVLQLPAAASSAAVRLGIGAADLRRGDMYALCTDELGAMAQVRGRWGSIRSQYDAFLAANEHDHVPVDRRVRLTRLRAWVVHRDYSREVAAECQTGFATDLGNRVWWDFRVPVGMGCQIGLRITLRMAARGNSVRLRVTRAPAGDCPEALPDDTPVTLIVRPDIEDRPAHETTLAYLGPEDRFRAAITPEENGFRFRPGEGRPLHCTAEPGVFVLEPEWQYMVPHPVEAGRGLNPHGDLFSPGYFRCTLDQGRDVEIHAWVGSRTPPETAPDNERAGAEAAPSLPIEEAARRALRRFIVRRQRSRTVIAGYPWFLDWGRDTLIVLRGIIAAGLHAEARDIIGQFARLERGGTLPNALHGEDDANRDTSDAPLWLGVAVGDYLDAAGDDAILADDCGGRTLLEVLTGIAKAYLEGTANGIRVDPPSGLVFSPAHFTWMDTNHPAATPREGYPIEIQALWHAALTLLQRVAPGTGPWQALARRVAESVHGRYPLGPGRGLRDCLHARPGTAAGEALPDDACRPNQLLAVTLGLVQDPETARSILDACAPLLVPGGIRSLADAPVEVLLAVYRDGALLNDPRRPYWGRYEGDEDTRRKPAYHNGTAWSWLFPSYAEAMVRVYGSAARSAALSLLHGMTGCMEHGCLGQLPEIVDGDAPHEHRGCGAQAWGVSELLRVLTRLSPLSG
ncbi:MAG: glycogen debranching enzyme N-terminal domain-containing protein, partial [Lentisphaeria bacterium]|nr:glycogen debranching enzyme N-terminal domain-containing protein [Lentisphaeria bacterium]